MLCLLFRLEVHDLLDFVARVQDLEYLFVLHGHVLHVLDEVFEGLQGVIVHFLELPDPAVVWLEVELVKCSLRVLALQINLGEEDR